MFVQVVADSVGRLSEVRSALEPRFAVGCAMLDSFDTCAGTDALVVAANLRVIDNITTLKGIIQSSEGVRQRIFVIDEKAHLCASRAHALGATHVLFGAAGLKDLLVRLNPGSPIDKQRDHGAVHTAEAGAGAFESMFAAVRTGKSVDLGGIDDTADLIASNVAADGLTNWLDTVRRHHEGTYQHCLLVTGIASDFALSLGLSKPDVQRLARAAMFHDIGKAAVPLNILDKPGGLNKSERKVIETHPLSGYEALKDAPGISPEVLDAIRHHHEYLDGSGYPDGLDAASISDLVRMLTIADIFASLIERRSYKPCMPREKAYGIIVGMIGKLEGPLVQAFQAVALHR
jgi:putative nucleotidyltransferase with HDIG domain